MKAFLSFGVVFFCVGFLASLALGLFPSFTNDQSPRWLWPACAAAYTFFIVLLILTWKKRNDYVEVTTEGIVAHFSQEESNFLMTWDEIVRVEESIQGACLKLYSRDGRKIRAEYQFNNFTNLLHLLEQNLSNLEDSSGRMVFRKYTSFYTGHLFILAFFGGFAAWACMLGLYWGSATLLLTLPTLKAVLCEPVKVVVEPTRVFIASPLRHRVIEMDDIRNIQLDFSLNALSILIQERRSGTETKLGRFKNIFHLNILLKNNHKQ